MKIIFIQILLLFSTASLAQTSYFDGDPIWQEKIQCSFNPPCLDIYLNNYYVNGDTIIGNHLYKKIFSKGTLTHEWLSLPPISPSCQGETTFNDSMSPIAFMRDSLKRIYTWDQYYNDDALLYDFNLSIGDSLPLTNSNSDSAITVISIDSFRVGNLYRKSFLLSNNSHCQYWLEGIGNEKGLLEPYYNSSFECSFELLCYGLNDSSYYPTIGTTCDLHVGIIEPKRDISVSIYPNPFHSIATLKSNSHNAELAIYNVLGILVEKIKINYTSTALDRNKLSNGMYFYQLVDVNGEKTNGKFVVE